MNKGEGDTFPPIDNKALLQCMFFGVKVAERVADGARADHLRVDLLVKGDCSDLFVSEVELYPAVPFSEEAKQLVAARWRYGYGFD